MPDIPMMGGGGGGGGAKPEPPAIKAIKYAGRTIAAGGRSLLESAGKYAENVHPVEYRHGGKVRKTGRAKLHKGERVIPRSKVKKVERLMNRKKMRMKSSGRS